jgi:hypothetical protein
VYEYKHESLVETVRTFKSVITTHLTTVLTHCISYNNDLARMLWLIVVKCLAEFITGRSCS